MIASAPRAFAFVPQRTGSQSNDRKFINTHLSRLAAERRKRGKPRTQTVSSRSPPQVTSGTSDRRRSHVKSKIVGSDVSTKGHIDSPSCNNVGPRVDNTAVATPSPTDASLSEPVVGHKTPARIVETDSPVLSTPSSILLPPSMTSYDAFRSTLMPVDLTTKTLLDFSSETFRPWVDRMERGQDKASAYSNKFYHSTCDALQDKTIGYATLARLATVASRVTQNQEVGIAAVELKSKAYQSLRQQITTRSVEPDSHLLTQMFALLSMEVAGQNLKAAAVHAKTLQQLVQARGTDRVSIDDDLIRAILWHECMRGSFSLGRPVFDIERLGDHNMLRNCLASTGGDLYSMGLMPDTRPSGFHHCGLPTKLLDLVTEFRFMSNLSQALRQAPSMITVDVMSAFTFRATSISSSLLILFNDAQDALDDAFPNSEQDLYRTGAVCLAARFWYRCATSHELIDAEAGPGCQMFQVYGTQGPVLEKLQAAFEYCQQTGTIQAYPKLWLWLLYVGTLAERANIDLNRHSHVQRGTFFKHHFTAFAWSLGCYSWETVEHILSTFLYSNEVGPLSRDFFDRSVRQVLKGCK